LLQRLIPQQIERHQHGGIPRMPSSPPRKRVLRHAGIDRKPRPAPAYAAARASRGGPRSLELQE
ncbi:MAG TPA: hypothetical protein VJK90_09930, partial [Acetobacteraceae bacterium]|nr:hypothetical protein [Acetobacteraceae bacterium]